MESPIPVPDTMDGKPLLTPEPTVATDPPSVVAVGDGTTITSAKPGNKLNAAYIFTALLVAMLGTMGLVAGGRITWLEAREPILLIIGVFAALAAPFER